MQRAIPPYRRLTPPPRPALSFTFVPRLKRDSVRPAPSHSMTYKYQLINGPKHHEIMTMRVTDPNISRKMHEKYQLMNWHPSDHDLGD